jgi:hypothetical protein
VCPDLIRYSNEHRTLLLDRNSRNRSLFFNWLVPEGLTNSSRRYSPVFTIENYSFQVGGAARTVMALAPPTPLPSLTRTLTRDLRPPFPAPHPLHPLPQLIVDPSGNPFVPLVRPGVSMYLSCCPTSEVTGVSPTDGKMETRQPGGDWECCVGFTLSICNRRGTRRSVAWASNLAHDRFCPEVREWGVHRLMSLRRLRDPANGYLLEDGAIKVQARVRLLYMKVRVLTHRYFRRHQGFGLLDPTTCSATHDTEG